MRGTRRSVRPWCWIPVLLVTGCASTSPYDVDALDVSKLDPDEGIFVMRVLTQGVQARDGVEVREASADIDYGLNYGTTASVLGKFFSLPTRTYIGVEGERGEHLVVRRASAGDYFVNEFSRSGYQDVDLAVRFTVFPGEVVYVGDLRFEFVDKENFFGMSDYREFRLAVDRDGEAVRRALEERFQATPPPLRTSLMEVEAPPMF